MATSLTDAAGRFPPGAVLSGRYRLVSLVGKGGMGEVYRADDLVLGEPMALKFLPADAAADPALMERFLTEVRLARKVTHPNVARVHDIGEAEGRTFLSMEYVDGEDLGQLLKRIGRLPAEKALEISKQICEGLHAAHDRGVLHRDLKPANIMLDGDGRVRITDFGLAELTRDASDGRVMGTPAYMSPEQITGGEVDARSDIYSLGLVLYELFTGKRAFEGGSLQEYQELQTQETPTRPSTLLEQLDPAVEAIILRCIEKDPDARPSTARQVTLGLPGGDPLAAALAGGHTPAPELVAAAGSREAAPVGAVRALMAAWLALVVAVVALSGSDPDQLLRSPDEKPPQVLLDKVRTLLPEVGYRTPPTDWSSWYETDRATHAARDAAAGREDDTAAFPTGLRYAYRQAVGPLRPRGSMISGDDPASVEPGMVSARVDATGRLTALHAVPGGPDDTDAEAVPDATWAALLEAAGLSASELEPVDEPWLPPVHTSEHAVRRVTSPGLEGWRVRTAGQRGLPVVFELLPPASDAPPPVGGSEVFEWFRVLLLAAGAALGWRNLRGGRADLLGARRLAVVGFVTHLVLWLGTTDMPTGISAWHAMLVSGLGYDFYIAVHIFVFYLALEPFVRRRWPSALISWSRVLRGRLADPLAGRDVLAGGVAALGFDALMDVVDRVARASGAHLARGERKVQGLESAADAAAGAIHAAGDAVMFAMVLLLVLVLLQSLVRHGWITVVVWAGLPVVLFLVDPRVGGPAEPIELVVPVAFMLVFRWVAGRFGILSCCVYLFVMMLVNGLPLSPDPGVWFAHTTLVVVLTLLLLGGWAARAALAGRPVFAELE